MSERARRRWPSHVFDVGEEPDPRFTLANERTFLAWIRTSVALLAAGIALDAFVEDVPTILRRACAGVLIVLGIVCSVAAYRRWMVSERALRLGRPLPAPALAPVLAYAIAGCGLLAALLVLFQAMMASVREDGNNAGVWDRGLQNERTSLAWVRTTLTLLAAGLVLARIAYARQPVLGLLLAFGSLAIAAWILQRAVRRYRRATTLLKQGDPLPDGRLPAALSLLVVLIGLASLVLFLVPQ